MVVKSLRNQIWPIFPELPSSTPIMYQKGEHTYTGLKTASHRRALQTHSRERHGCHIWLHTKWGLIGDQGFPSLIREQKPVPDVSGQVPCMRPNMFPQALLTAAILASTGRLWITNDTSFLCCLARFCAWPRIPKPVMSVAAWALNVCIRPAAERSRGVSEENSPFPTHSLFSERRHTAVKKSTETRVKCWRPRSSCSVNHSATWNLGAVPSANVLVIKSCREETCQNNPQPTNMFKECLT